MSTIRIVVADDHEVVRRGLVLVLRQEPDFEIAGEAENGRQALELARTLQPDIIILDWKMPEMDGLAAAAALRSQAPQVRTLLLSGAPIENDALDALDNGVDGFVHKDISPANLAHAIRVVASGKAYIGPEITRALIDRAQEREFRQVSISPRETDVLRLMASAATYREIGEQLYISEETVRTHAKHVMSKLNQPNRTQAVIEAIRLGLISLD